MWIHGAGLGTVGPVHPDGCVGGGLVQTEVYLRSKTDSSKLSDIQEGVSLFITPPRRKTHTHTCMHTALEDFFLIAINHRVQKQENTVTKLELINVIDYCAF